MKDQHPYHNLESLPLWKVVEKGIRDLNQNGDLDQTTASRYIIGYLVQQILASGLVDGVTDRRPRPRKRVSKIVMLRPFRKRMRAKSIL